jgi:hypothetical protein
LKNQGAPETAKEIGSACELIKVKTWALTSTCSKQIMAKNMGYELTEGTRLVPSKNPVFYKGKGTVVMFKKSQSFGEDSYLSSAGDWFCPDYICRGG